MFALALPDVGVLASEARLFYIWEGWGGGYRRQAFECQDDLAESQRCSVVPHLAPVMVWGGKGEERKKQREKTTRASDASPSAKCSAKSAT